MFQRIVLAALVAGLVAGFGATLIQRFGVAPLIFAAETYEIADAAGDHGDEAWAPADGLERTLFTGVANVVIGVGFGLLLAGAFAWRGGRAGWRPGLAWGGAGFLVFALLPALGLPPEVPGAEAAPLADRQLWWLGTVVASGTGLGLAAFAKGWPWRVLGLAVVALPHLIGAPAPEVHGGSAPAEIAEAFIGASLVAGALFWLLLGAAAGVAYERLAPKGV